MAWKSLNVFTWITYILNLTLDYTGFRNSYLPWKKVTCWRKTSTSSYLCLLGISVCFSDLLISIGSFVKVSVTEHARVHCTVLKSMPCYKINDT